jgi:hypothetical protein
MPAKKSSTKKAAPTRGPLPPYGIAIKEAAARGNVAEMKKTAASARKWLKEVQSALEALEKTISKK